MRRFIPLFLLVFSLNSFSFETGSEHEFRLRYREKVTPDKLELKDKTAEAKEELDQAAPRKPSSFEKRRQEAEHWKIQKIIDRRDRF
ncbi:MAG: hypothetical protein CME61_05240 [Halobacteriovoraceae bacterium]|nr:hypothetical protein [Halobacteriovoraceae bacterium]